MMRTLALVAVLIGSAGVPSGASAQDFRIEEVAAVDTLPIAQLKPKTIVFADRPSEQLIDASTGFIRYEDWARALPVQKKFLSLYPGYSEPNEDVIVDGTKKRYREKLHMYVAQARFVLTRPAAALDLARTAAARAFRCDGPGHGRGRPCGRPTDPAAHQGLGAPAQTAGRSTAPTGLYGASLTKAVRSLVKHKRSNHLLTTGWNGRGNG